mgnify:CR=1 FL=1
MAPRPERTRMKVLAIDRLRQTIDCAATIIIALGRAGHEPYVKERLPEWVDVVDYWEVADLHALTADDALGRIERAVTQLVRDLKA